MTGIAITLATKEDAEAVAAIEKLTNTKIPRFGDGAQPVAVAALVKAEPSDSEAKPERKPRARRERAPRERQGDEAATAASAPIDAPRSEIAAEAPQATAPAPARSRAPAAPAEDAKPARRSPRKDPVEPTPQTEPEDDVWNGPMPSFLGVKLT
jgi:hypothetical protein